MLSFSPWKIEQNDFVPEEEILTQVQLAFSNGYISQNAFFEEYFSGKQQLGTFIEGVCAPDSAEPLCLPNMSAISVRLNEERLNLAEWKVTSFYRCLYRSEMRLERKFTATSPLGHTVEVHTRRTLSQKLPNMFEIEYQLKSVDYSGPISFLSLLGDADRDDHWYPLQTSIDTRSAYLWLQASNIDLQVCGAMRYELFKNGVKMDERPIQIDKKRILGYAHLTDITPGDVYLLKKYVVIVDSRTCPKNELTGRSLELLG